jgi:hypothetical protein
MRLVRGMATLCAIVCCAGLASALAADGIDLTGEWHGTEICDELDGGEPAVFTETSPILIRQRSNGRFTMLFRLENGQADVIYEGIVQKVTGGGQEAIAIACGGAFESQEVIRLRPVIVKGRTGFFNGESQFFTDDFPGSGGAVNFGTCKYAYERVTTTPPVIERCRPSPIGGK